MINVPCLRVLDKTMEDTNRVSSCAHWAHVLPPYVLPRESCKISQIFLDAIYITPHTSLFVCFQRWLARKGREEQSLLTLSWFRKLPIDDPMLQDEFTDILATVKEEKEHKGTFQECLKRGNSIRFFIAFSIFTLQQFCGQVCRRRFR